MISIRLSYNKGYKWFSENGVYVKGYVLTPDGQLLRDSALLHYFSSVETADDFKEKLQQANGLFSVVIQRADRLFAAVDTVRAFPLFYYQKGDFLAVTDCPDALAADNVPLVLDKNNAVILRYAGFVTGNKTLLKDVFQIVAGGFICFEENNLTSAFHTQFLTTEFFSLSREQLKEALKEALFKMGQNLVKALNGRPVVIPLSGGFDSRILAYLLKKNNYNKVFCYTYGAAGNAELSNARSVAERLGFEWFFTEYNEFYDEKMNQDPVFQEYTHFAACYNSQATEHEYFAFKKLVSLNKIAEDAVFVPGHAGSIAGQLLTPKMADPAFDYGSYTLETFFSQTLPRKKEISILKKEIGFLKDFEQKPQYPPYLIFENWLFQEVKSKFNHNSAKIWDFFGHEYLLPLWDAELFNFFVKVPFSHKYDKNLYKETLAELFSEYDIFFQNDELYPSEKLVGKVAFRSKLKKRFPFLKRFVNIWKTDQSGSQFYMKGFIEELKKAGCYRKMLNINGILSAWYLLEVGKRVKMDSN